MQNVKEDIAGKAQGQTERQRDVDNPKKDGTGRVAFHGHAGKTAVQVGGMGQERDKKAAQETPAQGMDMDCHGMHRDGSFCGRPTAPAVIGTAQHGVNLVDNCAIQPGIGNEGKTETKALPAAHPLRIEVRLLGREKAGNKAEEADQEIGDGNIEKVPVKRRGWIDALRSQWRDNQEKDEKAC